MYGAPHNIHTGIRDNYTRHKGDFYDGTLSWKTRPLGTTPSGRVFFFVVSK